MKRPTASQLRAFNEVASQGSFSRAAAALGVTQPAVTAQIRALEDGFDVRLFERTGAGARLTQIGRRLFHRTSALRDTEREAAEILTAAQALTLGELSIVAGAPGPAMALLARYRALYPGISVQIDFGNWQQVVTAVRSRKADLGLLTGAPGADGFVSQPFLVQRIVALVPEGHGLAGRADVTLAELTREPLLFRTPESLTQRQVNARLAELGLAPEPLMVLAAREAVYEACAQGLGIGFMFDAASTRSDRVRRIPIADLPDSYAEDLFCLESQRKLRTVAAFFHLCGPG